MPPENEIEKYATWFRDFILSKRATKESTVDLIVARQDLYRIDNEFIQGHDSSYLWRFHPSAVVVEVDRRKGSQRFHVLLAVSNAIALKDVGELNCYVRIMNAASGCLVSPKGVSNEVRLLQANASIRNRLFITENHGSIFLVEWDQTLNTIMPESVIPIETQL